MDTISHSPNTKKSQKHLKIQQDKLINCIKTNSLVNYFDRETSQNLYRNLFENNYNPKKKIEDYELEFSDTGHKKFWLKLTIKGIVIILSNKAQSSDKKIKIKEITGYNLSEVSSQDIFLKTIGYIKINYNYKVQTFDKSNIY